MFQSEWTKLSLICESEICCHLYIFFRCVCIYVGLRYFLGLTLNILHRTSGTNSRDHSGPSTPDMPSSLCGITIQQHFADVIVLGKQDRGIHIYTHIYFIHTGGYFSVILCHHHYPNASISSLIQLSFPPSFSLNLNHTLVLLQENQVGVLRCG